MESSPCTPFDSTVSGGGRKSSIHTSFDSNAGGGGRKSSIGTPFATLRQDGAGENHSHALRSTPLLSVGAGEMGEGIPK